MTQLPEINWHQIRGKASSGSRRDGFEELGNQLMIYGGLVTWPAGTTFTTFGNPDGGREGRGELPGGATWGWQAKYLFTLDDDVFTQIDKSIRRVLTTEPTLERHYVLLPCNRPGGDTVNTKSAWTKWNERVTKWEAAAASAGITTLMNRAVGASFVGTMTASLAIAQLLRELNTGIPALEVISLNLRTPEYADVAPAETVPSANPGYAMALPI